MKPVRFIAYRFLTAADYFNMYKRPGTEDSGGGQLYVDFPTATISAAKWQQMFRGLGDVQESVVTHGRRWKCRVRSVAVSNESGDSLLEVYQRRPQSICIANQNIYARHSQRVAAWHPSNGFPKPRGEIRRGVVPVGLCVFLVRTWDGELWASWFRMSERDSVCETVEAAQRLEKMLDPANEAGDAGFIQFEENTLGIYEGRRAGMFTTVSASVEDDAQVDEWFDEDDKSLEMPDTGTRERFRRVRDRNRRAVHALKELYGQRCQITGEQFVFETRDGGWYVEAHHLIPLGEGGADDPHNIIVVSAHVHRMLHHAVVEPFDLREMHVDRRGWGKLAIVINGQPFEVRWHPRHVAVVQGRQRVISNR